MKVWAKKETGFTIVELLIVIIVIGILAAITLVGYRGILSRVAYTRALSDIRQTQKVIEIYYADNGSYPVSPSWTFQSAANRNTYITGVVPELTNTLPMIENSGSTVGQYIYRTNSSGTPGTSYKLVKYRSAANGGIATDEWNLVPASLKDSNISNQDRYGVWSTGGEYL